MDPTQQVVVLAGTLSTLVGGILTFLIAERNYWRAKAERLETEAKQTAEEQGREVDEWKRLYLDAQRSRPGQT